MMDDSLNEIFPPAIHTLIRGGVTIGAALKSRATYKGTVVLSILPFIADISPFNVIEKSQISYRNDIVAHYITHEFGHLLMYYPDDYANPKCLMQPARGFDFFNWYLQVKNGHCEKPSKKVIKYIKRYYQS